MNFIGVELASTVETSVPNGAKVSHPASKEGDFKTVLEKTRDSESIDTREEHSKTPKAAEDVLERDSSEHVSKKGKAKSSRDAGQTDNPQDKKPRIEKTGTEHAKNARTGKKILSFLHRNKNVKTPENETGERVAKNAEVDLDINAVAELLEAGSFEGDPQQTLIALEELGITREDLVKIIMERAQGDAVGKGAGLEAGPQVQLKGEVSRLLHLLTEDTKKSNTSKSVSKKDETEIKLEKEPSVKVVDLRAAARKDTLPVAELTDMSDAEDSGDLELVDVSSKDGKARQVFSDILENREIFTRDRNPVSAAESARFRQFMREQGNAEIVKDAKLILKDETTGEIKLILKPERLGEVRIRLSLEDNRIAGKIIVENNSIRAYFEENMADLLDEFMENGFEHAGLDVSVRQDSGQRQGGRERHISQSAVASVFEEQVPQSGYEDSDGLINLVV